MRVGIVSPQLIDHATDEILIKSLNGAILDGWDVKEKSGTFIFLDLQKNYCAYLKKQTGETVEFPKEITVNVICALLFLAGWFYTAVPRDKETIFTYSKH